MIKLKHPLTGEIKMVEEDVPFQRCFPKEGWCWEVMGAVAGPANKTEAEFEEQTGLQFGDQFAKLTKAFGITPCSKCEQRRKVLNEIRKRGIKGTLKALKKIGV